MTLSLTDTLKKLAILLPSRVKVDVIRPADNSPIFDIWVYADLDWRPILQNEREKVWHGVAGLMWLERGLREECTGRNLHWQVGNTDCVVSDWDRRRFTVSWRDFANPEDYAPTHALALALLAALEDGL